MPRQTNKSACSLGNVYITTAKTACQARSNSFIKISLITFYKNNIFTTNIYLSQQQFNQDSLVLSHARVNATY